MISKKGFTLFEILLVVTIMAIISIAALTSTVSIQKQFVFINTFKSLLSKVREVRFYAVTQKSVTLKENTAPTPNEEGIPSSYGVHINKNSQNQLTVTVFADLLTSTTQNEFDPPPSTPFPLYTSDYTIGAPLTLDGTKYKLEVFTKQTSAANATSLFEITGTPAATSLTLLYPPSEIKITASGKDGAEVIMITDPYIYLRLTDTANTQFVKTIQIFRRSGIAEESQNIT